MSALPVSVRRHSGLSIPALFLASLAFGCGSSSVFASLIGTNYYIRYDGDVKSGANTGTEGHANTLPFATNNIPTHEIPVTINPGAPLPNARVLTVTETEFAAPMSTDHVVLDIQGKASAGGPDVFVSPLNPGIAFPVHFEGHFYDNDPTKALVLDLNKTIDVGGGVFHDTVELENFGTFYKLPAAQKHVSGAGTINDPLKLLLDIPASMVPINNGRVKVHLYFGEGSPPVPEPATAALVLVGVAGLGVCGHRRARG